MKKNKSKSHWRKGMIGGAVIALSVFLIADYSFARTKVQSDEEAYSSGTSDQITIEDTDTSKAILMVERRGRTGDNDANPDSFFWGCRFTNIDGQNITDDFTCSREVGGTANETHLEWDVWEYDGFNVEHYSTTFSACTGCGSQTVNFTVSDDVDYTADNSFIYGYVRLDAGETDTNDLNGYRVTLEFDYDSGAGGADRVILKRYDNESTDQTEAITVYFSTVELVDDSVVYTGEMYRSNTANNEDWTFTEDIEDSTSTVVPMDRSKSFLLSTWRQDDSALRHELRMQFASDTQLAWHRTEDDTAVDFAHRWWALEFGTLGRVASGTALRPEGVYTAQVTIEPALSADLSLAWSTQTSTGPGNASYRIIRTSKLINNNATIEFEQSNTGQNAVIDFFAPEMEAAVVFTPVGGETWQTTETHDITWYLPGDTDYNNDVGVDTVEILLFL